ncbi:unnamed protein product [Miscanthus lutarioriparius]|uniref:Uncharacterized protein n=1 Tax=Miscanthus lutarioriparius TaxID=422564 RepID=A0A811RZU9_9POAL|nr:unnamed protein product [Miscanthus lutarioriparius]
MESRRLADDAASNTRLPFPSLRRTSGSHSRTCPSISPAPRGAWRSRPCHSHPSARTDCGRPSCTFVNAFGVRDLSILRNRDPGASATLTTLARDLFHGGDCEGESNEGMEGFLVSAATGALKAVTLKLATLLGDEFKNIKDVRKEIKSLADELKYMHAFLEKMSEEENPDNQDKIWMANGPGGIERSKSKMEGFLVGAATGALKAVTVKLATLLGDEFKNMKDVRKEIKPLFDELNYMHAFLEKMSEEENPDNQDKIWMTDVREMSYDIEDSLDDFMICIDDDKSAKKKSLMKKCTKLLDKMKAHKRISKAIQEFKTQIKEVGDRNHRYRTGVTTTKDSHEMIDIRAQAIFKDASELVAIDEQKNELINLLIEDGSLSQHQVKVVAIVGLGGLGKTTLANQVYESLKDKFDCKAFVTVSRTPHMLEVLRTILLDISGQEYTGDMQHLMRKISDFLQDKRYARKQLL